MFKLIFGKTNRLDRKTLAHWLAGTDIKKIETWQTSFTLAFLRELDSSGLVEQYSTAANRSGDGLDMMKGAVIQFFTGGPLRIGFVKKSLTPEQESVALRVSNEIIALGYGDLFVTARSTATIHAMSAWYAENYKESIAIATHVSKT